MIVVAGFWWQLLGVFLAGVGLFSHCHSVGLLVWGWVYCYFNGMICKIKNEI